MHDLLCSCRDEKVALYIVGLKESIKNKLLRRNAVPAEVCFIDMDSAMKQAKQYAIDGRKGELIGVEVADNDAVVSSGVSKCDGEAADHVVADAESEFIEEHHVRHEFEVGDEVMARDINKSIWSRLKQKHVQMISTTTAAVNDH